MILDNKPATIKEVGIASLIWKIPVVALAVVVGAIAANQAGWSGAELVINHPLMSAFEEFITGIFFSVAAVGSIGAFLLVQRIARLVQWLMVPIYLYTLLVLGVWNGFLSDFDAARLEILKHNYANAYALEHMSLRVRYRTCVDDGIELTDDAKAVCAGVVNVSPGERIPGSEHRCGFLGMFACFNTTPEK